MYTSKAEPISIYANSFFTPELFVYGIPHLPMFLLTQLPVSSESPEPHSPCPPTKQFLHFQLNHICTYFFNCMSHLYFLALPHLHYPVQRVIGMTQLYCNNQDCIWKLHLHTLLYLRVLALGVVAEWSKVLTAVPWPLMV